MDGHGTELETALTRVRRRWLAASWLHGLARVTGGVALGLLVVIAVELLVAPPDVPLLAVAGAVVAAALAFGARVLWPLRRPPSDARVARFVEERYPELEDRVASAAALAAARPTAGFHELIVADAAERLRGLDLARVVAPARLRRAVARGLLALAAFAAVVSLGSGPLGRVVRTAWLHASPSVAELVVDPGDFRLVAGQPLRVRARFEDGGGAPARTPPVLAVLDGMTPREIRMRPTGDAYLAEFPSVTRGFRYRVAAGAFTSRDYRVEALSPPRVTRIDVEYLYPPFTGLAPRVEQDGGDLFAPAGTVARLVVHTDEPVAEGVLRLSGGGRVVLADAGGARLTGSLVVDGNGGYRVSVVDAHGLSNRDATDYLIRATADRPPTVRVLRPGGDREITPLEEVTIEVRADDDHAVDRVDLVYAVAGRAERVLPFDVAEGASAVTGVRTLLVEDLGVEPGDVITYFARVRDAARAGVATEARSDLYFLEIRPFDNEFEEALSQGGLGPQAAEVGRLVELQKQIVVATWRLDQQAEDRSDDDVRAVAEVQGDLRDETAGAAAAAGGGLGRSRRGAAGDDGQAVQRRAMQAAVEAMTAAEAALAALDTAAAMPHETEALNQLLTAQAAVRRRQVSMQPRAGSAGRQAQLDLSQLFDRELRRDQETSYETGRRPGEPEQDEEDEALARLRELSRRQERINRDIGQPPETETDDERRRLLERLRREQQELRAALEALAQRLGGGPGAAGSSGSRGAAGEELRRAAEEMERAGSGLRREDTGAAREHGDRAVDALRRVAERLGEIDGERRSRAALGDLQLEAQQLAEAQGRLAGEMEQGAGGEPGSRYRELMAGEKEDLAQRAEGLERGLFSLRGGGDAAGERPASAAPGGDPMVAEAHRTLVGEQVAERMRAGAERLRAESGRRAENAASPAGPADEEAALAEVLATVAGFLRQAMAGDERQRRLAAELETARRLRERLEASSSGDASGTARVGGPSDDASAAGEPSRASRPGDEAGPPDERSGGGGSASGRRVADRSQRSGPGGGGSPDSGQEAAAELAQRPELLRALGEANPGLPADLERWVRQWRSLSAPNADPARLDFAHWTSLRRDLVTALHRFEGDRARELADRALRDRYAAPGDDAVPERYRRLVEQYYRSLADPRAAP